VTSWGRNIMLSESLFYKVVFWWSISLLIYLSFFVNKSVLFTNKHELCRLSQKKLPWVQNKRNWMPSNLVIFFCTKEKQRGVSRCEVLTLLIMKISVFSYVTSCSLAGIYQQREENYCFNLQTWYLRKVGKFLPQYTTAHSSNGYLLFIFAFCQHKDVSPLQTNTQTTATQLRVKRERWSLWNPWQGTLYSGYIMNTAFAAYGKLFGTSQSIDRVGDGRNHHRTVLFVTGRRQCARVACV